jgi:hypothetical protein
MFESLREELGEPKDTKQGSTYDCVEDHIPDQAFMQIIAECLGAANLCLRRWIISREPAAPGKSSSFLVNLTLLISTVHRTLFCALMDRSY